MSKVFLRYLVLAIFSFVSAAYSSAVSDQTFQPFFRIDDRG